MVKQNDMESVSASRVMTLSEGTWTISAAVNVNNDVDVISGFDEAKVRLHAVVLDSAAAL